MACPECERLAHESERKGNVSLEPAFPRPLSVMGPGEYSADQDGMKLLDYFAAHALIGYVAGEGPVPDHDVSARWAYAQAIALMEERARVLERMR